MSAKQKLGIGDLNALLLRLGLGVVHEANPYSTLPILEELAKRVQELEERMKALEGKA